MNTTTRTERDKMTRTTNEAITDGTKALFIELVNDSGNWSGSPLFGGNVADTPASKGHLTHLKKLELVTTYVDEEDDTVWVNFTEQGVAYAVSLGAEWNAEWNEFSSSIPTAEDDAEWSITRSSGMNH